ncbi:hypothetical protein WP5S18E01_21020 [Enterobacter cloacae]|nr:hypothetical protein WP5S18E01_21020 [Enterobacter cloacae]
MPRMLLPLSIKYYPPVECECYYQAGFLNDEDMYVAYHPG